MARTRTPAEDQSLAKLLDGLEDLQENVELWKRTKDTMPAGWLRAHKTAPCHPPKVKMTLRVDREVHEFFRALGVGYQRRMNEVLRCYMHAIVSKHIKQPGDKDWKGDPL